MFTDTLFGHEKGAFTGADSNRPGLAEDANKGSLFLDEIGDLDVSSQVKLLDFLDKHEFRALGSDKAKTSEARIIAATNADLEKKIGDGKFRDDLYNRFTHKLYIPPLRERYEDLPELANHFLEIASNEAGKEKPAAPEELFKLLGTYYFPGNIRDLRSMIFEAVSKHQEGMLSLSAFKKYMKKHPGPNLYSKAQIKEKGQKRIIVEGGYFTLKELEKVYIDEVLEKANGNQTIAARYLGIDKSTLSRKLKKNR